MRQVAERGSEPARFAFQDARILFSRVAGLEALLRAIARYPAAGKEARMRRFYAQFEAWHWYAHEALRLDNRYLLGAAISKMVLFGGRLILTHNDRLYPYHKWFLKQLEQRTGRAERFDGRHRHRCTTRRRARRHHRVLRDGERLSRLAGAASGLARPVHARQRIELDGRPGPGGRFVAGPAKDTPTCDHAFSHSPAW